MLSVGGIVTPFIIAPFLANRIKKHTTSVNDLAIMLNKTTVSSNASQINDTNMTHINISDVFSICFDKGKETNISYSFDTVFCDNITEVQGGKRVEEGTLIGKTNIQYAFIILAVIGVTASGTVLAFLIADFKARNRNRKTAASNEIKNTGYRKYSISERLKYILLIIVAIQCYLIAAMSSKVYALLPSFFILQFTWTTPMASVAMSVFWIGKAAARLAGIFLSAQFKQSVLIPCFSLTYIISSAGLIISGLYQISELAWISTASLGIGLSILFPSLFAITEENISHVSGRIASFYLVFFVVGGVFDPLYTGYLMDKGSPMWFTYLIFAQSIIFLILFITVKLLLRAYGEWKTAEAEIEIEPMSEEGKTWQVLEEIQFFIEAPISNNIQISAMKRLNKTESKIFVLLCILCFQRQPIRFLLLHKEQCRTLLTAVH